MNELPSVTQAIAGIAIVVSLTWLLSWIGGYTVKPNRLTDEDASRLIGRKVSAEWVELSCCENSAAEEPFVESCRRRVEEQYAGIELGSGSVGGCFGSILCHELHFGDDGHGLHFTALATKWGIPVSILGELIWDHCKRLEPLLVVSHDETGD